MSVSLSAVLTFSARCKLAISNYIFFLLFIFPSSSFPSSEALGPSVALPTCLMFLLTISYRDKLVQLWGIPGSWCNFSVWEEVLESCRGHCPRAGCYSLRCESSAPFRAVLGRIRSLSSLVSSSWQEIPRKKGSQLAAGDHLDGLPASHVQAGIS